MQLLSPFSDHDFLTIANVGARRRAQNPASVATVPLIQPLNT